MFVFLDRMRKKPRQARERMVALITLVVLIVLIASWFPFFVMRLEKLTLSGPKTQTQSAAVDASQFFSDLQNKDQEQIPTATSTIPGTEATTTASSSVEIGGDL